VINRPEEIYRQLVEAMELWQETVLDIPGDSPG
jgi:hypothetical protein